MAIINIGDEEREAKIRKGVRQGCVLSHMIFNLQIEEAIKEFKDKIDTGIEIQGQKIAMLRFADDIALLGSNKKGRFEWNQPNPNRRNQNENKHE